MRFMSTVAEVIIKKCGGVPSLAKIAGVDVTRVYRWTYPKRRGGTGGTIPTKHQNNILKRARNKGIDLNPSDFFPEGSQ